MSYLLHIRCLSRNICTRSFLPEASYRAFMKNVSYRKLLTGRLWRTFLTGSFLPGVYEERFLTEASYCDLQNKWESLRRSSSSKLVQSSFWKPLKIPIHFASRNTRHLCRTFVTRIIRPVYLVCACGVYCIFPISEITTRLGCVCDHVCSIIIYIYIYIYIYIHTYIYTYIHTYMHGYIPT